MPQFIKSGFQFVIHYVGRPWFPALVAFLAAADIFIFIVPNDIFVACAVLARPKFWLSTALMVSFGSFAGATALALLVFADADFVLRTFPSVFASNSWQETADFLQEYGIFATFLGSVGPIPLQPFVFVGALSKMPTWALLGGVLTGRVVKYLFLSYCAAKMPHLLGKIFRVQVPEDYQSKDP